MAENTPTAEPQPLLLDRYRVEGMLGEGGLGTVVKVFDTRLKNLRAVKTLKRTLTADLEVFRHLEERFTREAEAGSRMGINPNTVAVYDLVAGTDGTLYLILEFVPGGTLADRIKQGPLPLADALRLTADAARGLQAAHEVGIVHRDIKPANIFLATDGRAQVGDFGIAQIDDLSGRTRSTVGHPGTPLYMSPEQAHMTAYVQPATDQYSLGLVLFEMLTGVAYRRLHAQGVQERLAEMAPPVRALIERMTAEDPAGRYPSTGAVVAAIQAIERHLRTGEEELPPLVEEPRTVVGEPATVVGASATVVDAAPPGVPTGAPNAPTNPSAATSGTPAVNLQPAPAVAPPLPTPATAPPGTNRGLLIGIGAAVVVALIVVGALVASHRGGSSTPVPRTATAPVAAAASAQSSAVAGAPGGTPTTAAAAAASGSVVSGTAAAGTAGSGSVAAGAPGAAVAAPVTSLLSYLDGKNKLPEEDENDAHTTVIGAPVQVVGIDLSRNEPAKLPAVAAPSGSRVIRTLWAPKGTLLATLVRAPAPGGFSKNLDLVVIDIATGKTTTVAKAINTLPAWSPDGTTLVYGLLTGPEKAPLLDGKGTPVTANGTAQTVDVTGFDVHLVGADGTKDRVIAHLRPFAQCGGGGGEPDPIQDFLGGDQFLAGAQQAGWAADNSLIAMTAGIATFTFRPDGSNVKQVASCASPEMGTVIGATTDDPYIPANNLQVRLQDDADALRWRYERGVFPTTIVAGCDAHVPWDFKPCDNVKKGTANAGYRNQIVARLPDGTEKTLTSSPTFKYHVAVSPDGTAIAFTGITVTDYAAAVKFDQNTGYTPYAGYTTDVYLVRLTGGTEQKVSTSGGGHHPSWQRDLPVKVPPRPTPVPGTPAAVLPAAAGTSKQ